MTGMRWGAWLNVIAGALLVLAPFALGYYTLSFAYDVSCRSPERVLSAAIAGACS